MSKLIGWARKYEKKYLFKEGRCISTNEYSGSILLTKEWFFFFLLYILFNHTIAARRFMQIFERKKFGVFWALCDAWSTVDVAKKKKKIILPHGR